MSNFRLRRREGFAAVGIEQRDMAVRIQQGLVIVLPMDVREAGADLIKLRQGNQLTVKFAEIFAGSGDISGDKDFFSIQFTKQLNDSFVAARSNTGGIRAAAEREADGFNQDRLAASGFSGYDVETVVKIDLRLFYDRKIFNTDMMNHFFLSKEASH